MAVSAPTSVGEHPRYNVVESVEHTSIVLLLDYEDILGFTAHYRAQTGRIESAKLACGAHNTDGTVGAWYARRCSICARGRARRCMRICCAHILRAVCDLRKAEKRVGPTRARLTVQAADLFGHVHLDICTCCTTNGSYTEVMYGTTLQTLFMRMHDTTRTLFTRAQRSQLGVQILRRLLMSVTIRAHYLGE